MVCEWGINLMDGSMMVVDRLDVVVPSHPNDKWMNESNQENEKTQRIDPANLQKEHHDALSWVTFQPWKEDSQLGFERDTRQVDRDGDGEHLLPHWRRTTKWFGRRIQDAAIYLFPTVLGIFLQFGNDHSLFTPRLPSSSPHVFTCPPSSYVHHNEEAEEENQEETK